MTDLRLVTAESQPVPERLHLVDNRPDSIPRQFGLTLTDCLLGILAAPHDAFVLERETARRILEEEA